MEIQIIKDWANQNQGFLAIILFLLALLIGWITGFFKWFFGKFNKKTPMIMKSNQKSGDDSTNFQAGRDINVNAGSSVALYSIEEVSIQLLSSVFGELPIVTKKQIENNQKSYFQALTENLGKIIKQNEELKKVINSPDFQYISKNAAISASRSPSADLHRNLSSLIIQRINNDDVDFKRIVYDEAISTISKLTIDQLIIITLCYLLVYTSFSGIVSWETFKEYLNTRIKPFLGFKNTNAEFQHIEYAGCGSIGIGSTDIINILKQRYSFLFLDLVDKAQIDSLTLPDEIKKEIIELDQEEDKYFIKFTNKIDFENYLEEKKIDKETTKKLVPIYEKHVKNNDEIKEMITKETSAGEKLVALWEKSKIKHLSLTSVGIVIGASYFEQTTGEKIDISNWIN